MTSKRKGWMHLSSIILAAILVPFFLFEGAIEVWTHDFLSVARERSALVSLVLGTLLATDILLPVPSSIVSTASGLFLGFIGGLVTSLVGMTISCIAGYALGKGFGRRVALHFVGSSELERMDELSSRFGYWIIVVTRAVPVLAEVSVLFAGISRMPFYHFILLSILSNLGISAGYAAIGAFSASVNSFLVAFLGSMLFPLLGIVFLKRH